MDEKAVNIESQNKSGRMLIVSYSYSGNTHQIAQKLQSLTQSDWEAIYPWQPYPMAFPELLSHVKQEIRNHYRPKLLPTSHRPQPYSVIFVGTPNWCGTIAPPLSSWLYRNNLSNKIILPFYSHCGGVSGDIRGAITKLCPKADVREALGVCSEEESDWKGFLYDWLEAAGILTASVQAGCCDHLQIEN